MNIKRKIASSFLSGAILLAAAGSAFAAPAVATGNVNVRSGPSTGYERVGTLLRNQLVEVSGCRAGWCFVEKRGTDGWVSSRFLQPVRPQRQARPSVSFQFNFGTVPSYYGRRGDHHDNGNGNNGRGGRDDRNHGRGDRDHGGHGGRDRDRY